MSAGESVTELMRMLAVAALFLGTSTSLDGQSDPLLLAPDIHWKVILYVANSSDQQFTFLLAFLPIKELLQEFVIIGHDDIRALEIIIPLGDGIIYPRGFLFGAIPFALSVCECM